MLSYLEQDCALTVLRLPANFTAGEELLQAVQPINVAISDLKMTTRTQQLYVFNWRLTYRADDKREEIYTVLLNENGAYIPSVDGAADPKAGAVDLASYYVDAENVPEARVDQPKPGKDHFKLPAMAQLTRLAEAARKYAIYHADLQCSVHESEILPRLHKTLARLTTYYEQQIAEVYDSHDSDGAKRAALESDLRRKVDEEIENHRLHVQIKLFSCAILLVPVAVADMTVRDKKNSLEIRILRNCYSGTLDRPGCHVCGEAVDTVALDRNGHLTCGRCLRQCPACGDYVCTQCGLAACPVCEQENCSNCATECRACGEAACLDHIDPCPVCTDMVCRSCRTTCAACGINQCRSHLRLDCVVADEMVAATESETAEQQSSQHLICADCAVRCPNCEQYSAHMRTCEFSGQRFCANCAVQCQRCKKIVGPAYYQLHPVLETALCFSCLDVCPQCGERTPPAIDCAVCERPCCIHCVSRCDACGEPLCHEHISEVSLCGHKVCPQHLGVCAVGYEEVCLACTLPCTICEHPYCAQHSARCERCRVEMCNECVRPRSNLCDTCATIDRSGELVSLLDEACIADERVSLLQPHYRWMKSESSRHIVYLGRDSRMRTAIIVVEKQKESYAICLTRKLGVSDSPYHNRWFE